MSIKSIKIKNLLSFDELLINEIKDINCIVGKNNTGKSNLLKLISFFYNKLEGKRELPPTLNSNYSSFGSITIIYDISHILKIVQADKNRYNQSLPYFKQVFKLLKKGDEKSIEVVLNIHSNDSINWNIQDIKLLKIISDLYPFFEIETRHIDLYDWDKLWFLISRLKPFNPHKVKQDKVIEFFEKEVSEDVGYKNYENYIKKIESNLETSVYSYREKVLSFVKTGLKGHSFLINNKQLETESDGINSYTFIKSFLILLISLTRKGYITPILYIDEPEVGLHPKRNEELINDLYEVTQEYSHYKTPLPNIIFSTHSANIVKEVIKLFDTKQQILHFSKNKHTKNTIAKKMNSTYEDKRFLDIFSDNEARLFFSNFILFVEGETELEIFRNKKLLEKFSNLKKIDVYKSSSNVFSENINPSYSNTAIPYIFLFDADKIYKFKRLNDKSKREIILEKNGNLYNLKKELNQKKDLYYKYDVEQAKIQNYINDIYSFLHQSYSFDTLTFKLTEHLEYIEFVNNLKSYLLSKYNIIFAKTTIEEYLINEKSINLFFAWFQQEYGHNESIFDITDEMDITEEILIDYIRVFFGGKFDIQVDYTLLEKEQDKSKKSKIIFDKIKAILSKKGKTSGWATSFLNYVVDTIENDIQMDILSDKKDQSENFRQEFKKYFGEFYDIITIIENKLVSDR